MRWPRMAVGCGVLLATMAFGPWSRAEEPSDIPMASAECTPEPATQAHGGAAGAGQTVTVEVPAIAIIDVVDDAPRGAWTNSGRPPLTGDEMYVRHDQGLTEASPTIRGEVLQVAWLPVAGDGCDPESWVVATRP